MEEPLEFIKVSGGILKLTILVGRSQRLFSKCSSSFKYLKELHNYWLMNKTSNEFTEYQRPDPVMPHNPKNDRVHPLDTVSILEFRTDHKRDVEEVFVHSGKYADELARSFNAMAITMAKHIV